MTLHLYFAKRFLRTFLAVLVVFFAILFLIDMIEQVRKFGDKAGFGELLQLTALNTPETLYGILPLIMILATLALFLGLARSSELVVTRASGRSALKSLIAPVIVAGLVGVVAVGLINPIVAATSRQYETLAGQITGAGSQAVSVTREGLWLRQGGADGQTVIRAARSNLDGTELQGVTFFGFDTEGRPTYRIEADRAALTIGAWAVENAKEWRFDTGGAIPELAAFEAEKLSLASNLTRSQIIDSFGTPSAIPIWELPGFIDRLEAAGFSARSHRTFFHMELALPVLLVSMVLVGAGFTMRHTRFGRTGLMVMMALGLGFSLYFIRNFAAILGESGQIPVVLAAWGPPVAAVLLPIGLLLHLEDG